MILNPSHDITLKGFPSEILDAYVRYKQGGVLYGVPEVSLTVSKGSRAIVSWLVQYGPIEYKGVKTLPIKELAALAASVTKYISDLPDVIHFHFKETIAARKRLSQFFRRTVDRSIDDVNTVNHEHFTTSLTQIYSNLCQQCCTAGGHRGTSSHDSRSQIPAKLVHNHYACLSVEHSPDTCTEDLNHVDRHDDQFEKSHLCSVTPPELDIENDEMSIAIETASLLERVHQTFATVATCWERAGKGQIHFLCASATTNAAWAILQDLDVQLRNIDPIISLSRLRQKCSLFKETSKNLNGTFGGPYDLLESLAESDRTIQQYCKPGKLSAVIQCPSCIQRPYDYMLSIDRTETGQPTSFPLALVDNVLHLICQSQLPSLVLNSSPIFAQISYLLTHRDDELTVFQSTLALHLLTISYRSYLTALSRPTTISNCRITALKLAKQASSTLSLVLKDKESFPCRCPQTLAFHLTNVKDDMEAYSKHRCWDLYFQSPWVAGNHMIEMLDVLSYYGMRLFHYHHYVAAVLHTYNVMIQLGGLNPIPILEHLIGTFKDVFFPAGLPTANFKNSWARYIGARLRFKKGHKRHANDRESWCMAVPAHAAKNAAGLGIDKNRDGANRSSLDPKFDYARIDPMMRLKQLDWRIEDPRATMSSKSEAPANNFPSSPLVQPASASQSSTAAPSSVDAYPVHLLQTALPTLESQIISSTLPTTRISHAKVYLACTNIIRHATRKIHTDPSDNDTKTCICFAHTLLSAADRIVEGRKIGRLECWKREERKVMEVFQDVLKEEIGESQRNGGDKLDLLWDI